MKFKGVTIDDAHSKDLDDAVWASPTADGGVHLTVCIADVAGAVPKGSELDSRVRERVTTRYWASGNNPMLPRHLSERDLSLLPNVSRDAFAIEMVLDPGGNTVGLPKITLGTLRSADKLAYDMVPGILADSTHPHHGVMALLKRVALQILGQRRAAGALAFYDLNDGWVTTEEGHLLKLERAQANIGYIIIQEMMILANLNLARYAAHMSVPVLYRNHTAKQAAPPRDEILRQIDSTLLDRTQVDVVRQRVHTLMNRATYDAVVLGHYGLSLPFYLHGSSPIRRYADLVTQRQLRAHLLGEPLPYTQADVAVEAEHIVTRLREAEDRASEAAKGHANHRAVRLTEKLDPVQLAALKPVEFERVLKVTLRSDEFSPEVAEAIGLRASSGTLTPLDMFLVLGSPTTVPDWQPIRQRMIRYLARNSHYGPSVCSIGMSVLGWSELTFASKKGGVDHAPWFKVQATLVRDGVKVSAPEVMATNVKVAKALATVNLLAVLVGVDPPDAEVPVVPKATTAPKPVVTDPKTNPVNALQEHAQQRRHEMPDYVFTRAGGEDHSPLFICTCTYRGVTHTSAPDGNKKTAKKNAAFLVWGDVA